MKKTLIFILILTLLLGAFVSCGYKTIGDIGVDRISSEVDASKEDDDTSQESNEVNSTETAIEDNYLHDIDVKPINYNNVKIWPEGTKLGFESKFDMFDLDDAQYFNNPNSSGLHKGEFIDASAPKTLKATILGEDYTLIYDHSINSLVVSHIYNVEEVKSARIGVDTKTGKIVSYDNMPYDQSAFSSEKDYTDFIKKFIDNSLDLSKFRYQCITAYDANGQYCEYEGFKEQFEEGEEFVGYHIYYYAYINDIKINGSFGGSFFNDHFKIRNNGCNYDTSVFSQTISRLGDLNEHLEEYMIENLKSGNTLIGLTFSEPSLFVEDGMVWVSTTASYYVNTTEDFVHAADIVSALCPM